MKKYSIYYYLYNNNVQVKSGQYIVKNCLSELHAKIKFENFIKTKYKFDKLEIYSCCEQNYITDLFSTFF